MGIDAASRPGLACPQARPRWNFSAPSCVERVERRSMSREGRVRSTSVVFPLLLIGFGSLLLMWRWFPFFNPWPVLWKYWPLLLILVGAGMFWDRAQRRSNPDNAPVIPVGSTIGTVLFLLVMAYLLWHERAFTRHDWMNVSAGPAHEHETQTVDRH